MSAERGMTGPHWDFALAVYGGSGVSQACLDLQDRFGVDVNVLLLALYANAGRGVAIDAQRVSDLGDRAREIREMAVVPLRDVRRAMKGRDDLGAALESVRNKVKSAELAAEQFEQAALADQVAQWPQEGAACDPEAVIDRVAAHFAPESGPVPETARETIAAAVRAAV